MQNQNHLGFGHVKPAMLGRVDVLHMCTALVCELSDAMDAVVRVGSEYERAALPKGETLADQLQSPGRIRGENDGVSCGCAEERENCLSSFLSTGRRKFRPVEMKQSISNAERSRV